MSPHVKARVGAGIAAAFFIVFFGGIGLIGLHGSVGTLVDAWRARDWVEVPATLASWSHGTAQYSYVHGGRVHTGRRLGTDAQGGESGLDDWDERMDRRLANAMAEERKVVAWVNPDQPEEAMLDREVRWKVVLVFLAIGGVFSLVGLFATLFVGYKALSPEMQARLPSLKEPVRHALWHWAVAFGWNLAAFPIAIFGIPEMWARNEWFPVVLMTVFPLVGLGILWSALLMTGVALREGNPLQWPAREGA